MIATLERKPLGQMLIDKGVIDASIGQNPDAQGHDPVIRLYNYLVAGQLPPYGKLLSKAELIRKENSARLRTPPR